MSVNKSCSFHREPKVNWIAFSYIVAEVQFYRQLLTYVIKIWTRV